MLYAACNAVKVCGRSALLRLLPGRLLPVAPLSALACPHKVTPNGTTVFSAAATCCRTAVTPVFLHSGRNPTKLFNTSAVFRKSEDWKAMLKSLPKRDEGTVGEKDMQLDPVHARASNLVEFPDEDTPTRLFNGVPFNQIPLMIVRTHKNNTIIIFADIYNKVISRTSCGQEGFKNCRKGTNVAAQSTAIAMAKRARELGATQVRVKIRGFGPGRAAAIKGFELGGLDVVSISDITYINWLNSPRPRKRKRL